MIYGMTPELPAPAAARHRARWCELDDPALRVHPVARDWADETMAHQEPLYHVVRLALATDDVPEPGVFPLPARAADELTPDAVLTGAEVAALPATQPLPLLDATAVFRADELVEGWRASWV